MKIRLRVEAVTFSVLGPYVHLIEPYQDAPDALDCDVKVMIPEKDAQGWILLLGKEVCFERVPPLSQPRSLPLPKPGRPKGSD